MIPCLLEATESNNFSVFRGTFLEIYSAKG